MLTILTYLCDSDGTTKYINCFIIFLTKSYFHLCWSIYTGNSTTIQYNISWTYLCKNLWMTVVVKTSSVTTCCKYYEAPHSLLTSLPFLPSWENPWEVPMLQVPNDKANLWNHRRLSKKSFSLINNFYLGLCLNKFS